MLGCPLVLSFT